MKTQYTVLTDTLPQRFSKYCTIRYKAINAECIASPQALTTGLVVSVAILLPLPWSLTLLWLPRLPWLLLILHSIQLGQQVELKGFTAKPINLLMNICL